MKKLIFGLALLLAGSQVQAQSLSVVEGQWEADVKVGTFRLYSTEQGQTVELASSRVGDDGTFAFAFYPAKEGFYSVGFAPGQAGKYTFYLKPGDNLKMKVTPNRWMLMGKNYTSENEEMARWQAFVEPLNQKNDAYSPEERKSTYIDFFPLYEEKSKELANYPVVRTRNARFNEQFARFREVDFLSKAVTFLFSPRPIQPKPQDFPASLRSIDLKSLGRDGFLLGYPDGVRLYSQMAMVQHWSDITSSAEQKAQRMARGPESLLLDDPELTPSIDPELLGELTVLIAQSKRTLEAFDMYAERYAKNLTTDAQRAVWNDIRVPLIRHDVGAPATDFMFPDKEGNSVSLSDFKGKVVYIDVWATWCGPCKGEIPHLKKLEEEFADNPNIVFIGVSVDKSADKQKWANFIESEALPGIQLFAGDLANDALMKPYQIKGIPRFILIGKDGNLIYSEAPRPSAEDVRMVLNNALK